MTTEPFQQPVNPFAKGPTSEQLEKQKYLANVNNRLKEQIVAVFANPHGLQLLETLKEIFLYQPVCPPGSVEGYGYKREGENQLIIRIATIVKNAMNPIQAEKESNKDSAV
jgi:hypothetical protein